MDSRVNLKHFPCPNTHFYLYFSLFYSPFLPYVYLRLMVTQPWKWLKFLFWVLPWPPGWQSCDKTSQMCLLQPFKNECLKRFSIVFFQNVAINIKQIAKKCQQQCGGCWGTTTIISFASCSSQITDPKWEGHWDLSWSGCTMPTRSDQSRDLCWAALLWTRLH